MATTDRIRKLVTDWIEVGGDVDAAEFDRWLNEQLAEAWAKGEANGWSRAMRHMSDEPNLGRQTENPYRPEES